MNEVVNISIAGIAFTMDNDAYEVLSKYLNNLNDLYKSNPDGNEIITDIEARIVELILSKQNIENVVSKEVIDDIIKQLGLPDDMSAEKEGGNENDNADTDTEIDANANFQGSSSDEQFPRRFYRDSENSKVGGVCSGLARYFHIDPVIFRISMFVPIFFLIILPALNIDHFNGLIGSIFGAIILLYIILWISVPLAKTPRQKLEMRGKKVTAAEIERIMSNETGSSASESRQSDSLFAKMFTIIGRLLLFSIKLFAVLIGFMLALAAIGMVATIVVAITGKSLSLLGNNVLFNDPRILFEGISGISPGGFIAMTIGLALIPACLLIYLIVKIIFSLKSNNTPVWIAIGAWVFLAVYMLIITIDNSEKIKENAEKIDSHYIEARKFDTNIEDMDKIGLFVIYGDTLIKDNNVIQIDKFEKFGVKPENEEEKEEDISSVITNHGDTLILNNTVYNLERLINPIKDMTYRRNFKLDLVSEKKGYIESFDTYINWEGDTHTKHSIHPLTKTQPK